MDKTQILIEGKDAIIRPLTEKELELKVKWINDPQVNKYLHYELPLRLDKTRKWFQKTINDKSRYDFIIETKDKQPIGLIGLINIKENDKTAEIYIAIGEKQYWGKGLMLNTEGMLIEWAFNHLGLEKIWGQTHCTNVASIITMKKLGFQIEGTLRKEKIVNGKREDVYQLGLLKDEFKFTD